MRIALVGSNLSPINKDTNRGPEMFIYTFLNQFSQQYAKNEVDFTAFVAGNSELPVKIESVNALSSLEDPDIGNENRKIYEQILFAKAFSQESEFDLFHINTGDEKVVLPFVQFTKKPVLITLHSRLEGNLIKKIYGLYKEQKNLFLVSISNSQRKPLPYLNFVKTIYHGMNIDQLAFNDKNDEYILFIGRGIPEKGVDTALETIKKSKRQAKFYLAPRDKHNDWLKQLLNQYSDIADPFLKTDRKMVIESYQKAKLFLFPIRWEEPFGLVMIEALACGTPVVAFAKGSVPEVIKDGETGFIVNFSETDKRGDWIVKKTGIDGLLEAIEKIYSLPDKEYKEMRKNCRMQVEKNFTLERVVNDYKNIYREILQKNLKNS